MTSHVLFVVRNVMLGGTMRLREESQALMCMCLWYRSVELILSLRLKRRKHALLIRKYDTIID
jgi:hypothetical protein